MENNIKPLLSVIMGIYNSSDKDELVRSIQSIKEQSFKQWECIICDDASDDDTYDFLKKITNNDARFRIIQNEVNSGLGASLNKALDEVKSDYVIRQDADDYSRTDRFEILYKYMMEHDEIDVLGTGMVLFDTMGEWGHYKIRTEEAKKEDFLIGTVVAHPSVIMKTQSLRANGGYRIAWETKRCEDYDLFMRMYANGYKIANFNEELYYYKSKRTGNKRKFLNVVKESVVRYKGFKKLGINAKKWAYIIKPFVVYFLPNQLVKKFK